MVVMGKGDAALMILETAEEAEPQTGKRAHQNPSCLLYMLYIYAQIMCLNCVPTRTHHACPVIPSRVLLRLVTLFINAMIWVSQFFKSPPEPINHHVSPVFPPLTYSLAFGHSYSKKRSESFSLMLWFELHNLSIVVRSFTTMIFTLSHTVVSFHPPLSAERKGGYE